MKGYIWLLAPLALVGCGDLKVGINLHGLEGLDQKNTTVGNGTVKEESRTVAAYEKVAVGSAFQVEATEGKQTPLTISADSNLLSHIKTEVRDKVLYVEIDGSVSTKQPMKLKLSTPTLKGFEASGATKVKVHLASAHDFDLGDSGASEVSVDGTVRNLTADLSGSSKADISGRSFGKVTLTLSGASQMELGGRAEALNAELSGASSLTGGLSGKSAQLELSGASNAKLGKFDAMAKQTSGASSVSSGD